MRINCNRLIKNVISLRQYSAAVNKEVEKSVIVSKSNDIYTNLALEDWYYKNWSWENRHLLILWSNNPCVVIGKFQNPWLEANVTELDQLIEGGVQIARRNTGGGTVYHDRGNLNLTFFTPREHYSRKHNLEVIANAVVKKHGLNITITKRDDLVIDDYKISGTAAKLGRTVAYHHCTLLVNSDKDTLSNSLKKPKYDIKTNATQSTKSKIKNLTDYDQNITVEDLMDCIRTEYLSTQPKYKQKDVEITLNVKYSEKNDSNLLILKPTENEYKGLIDIRNTLVSWDWIFGKCPNFTATKSYFYEQPYNDIKITFTVENGIISNTEIKFCGDIKHEEDSIELYDYKGRKFTEELFNQVFDSVCRQLNKIQVQKSIINTKN